MDSDNQTQSCEDCPLRKVGAWLLQRPDPVEQFMRLRNGGRGWEQDPDAPEAPGTIEPA